MSFDKFQFGCDLSQASKSIKKIFVSITFQRLEQKMYKVLLFFWRMGELGVLLSRFTDGFMFVIVLLFSIPNFDLNKKK